MDINGHTFVNLTNTDINNIDFGLTILDQKCAKCGTLINKDKNIVEIVFWAGQAYVTIAYVKNYLTCEEVQIKNLLE